MSRTSRARVNRRSAFQAGTPITRVAERTWWRRATQSARHTWLPRPRRDGAETRGMVEKAAEGGCLNCVDGPNEHRRNGGGRASGSTPLRSDRQVPTGRSGKMRIDLDTASRTVPILPHRERRRPPSLVRRHAFPGRRVSPSVKRALQHALAALERDLSVAGGSGPAQAGARRRSHIRTAILGSADDKVHGHKKLRRDR